MKTKSRVLNKFFIISLCIIFSILVLFSYPYIRSTKENISSNLFISLKFCLDVYKDSIIKTKLLINKIINTSEYKNDINIFNSEEYQELAIEIEILKGENAELKKLLNIVSQIPAEKTSAEVIFINNGMYNNSIKVRINNPEIVQKGDIAINHEGLVGRVLEVKGHYANIMLITDFASRIAVKSTQNSTKAILVGRNSNLSELSYFAQKPEVEDGNLFITLDDGDSMMSGIPVVTLEKYHNGKFYTKPVVNFNKLNFISILSFKK